MNYAPTSLLLTVTDPATGAIRRGRRGYESDDGLATRNALPVTNSNRREADPSALIVSQFGVMPFAEPIGYARPTPRRDPLNTVSRARPCRRELHNALRASRICSSCTDCLQARFRFYDHLPCGMKPGLPVFTTSLNRCLV
jgi:hypothetical protein